MAPDSPAAPAAEVAEDEALTAARTSAATLGCPAVPPQVGAFLRFLAAVLRARAVVGIGTGTGVSALYLIRGMVPDGVLTSIDGDPEHQATTKRILRGAGIAPGRTRLIAGNAHDVLPRLTDGGYDLVFIDSGRCDPAFHEQGARLLRPGGVLAVVDAAADVARAVRADDRFVTQELPLGEGLLVAARA